MSVVQKIRRLCVYVGICLLLLGQCSVSQENEPDINLHLMLWSVGGIFSGFAPNIELFSAAATTRANGSEGLPKYVAVNYVFWYRFFFFFKTLAYIIIAGVGVKVLSQTALFKTWKRTCTICKTLNCLSLWRKTLRVKLQAVESLVCAKWHLLVLFFRSVHTC